jgi:pSer/pThr/pTyr-binding forkhead associated (FHA) protein
MLKDAVISETILDKTIVTIGRGASNDIVIDNLAVSSFHARIIIENGVFTLEDLNSTNGTFVNDRRIAHVALNNNDAITIGKHTLLFSDPRLEDNPDITLNGREQISDKTIMIDARTALAEITANTAPLGKEPLSARLTIIDGPTETREYELVGRLATIGKIKTAEIRLKGFFAPRVAALINRGKEGYYISPPDNGRKICVNGRTIGGRTLLAHGDTVEVWKVKMQFHTRS